MVELYTYPEVRFHIYAGTTEGGGLVLEDALGTVVNINLNSTRFVSSGGLPNDHMVSG